MNNNLPMKEEISFIGKIKNFFKKIFGKSKIESVEKQINTRETINKTSYQENDFNKSLKAEPNAEYIAKMKQEEFIQQIESNPELLYELPIEKLKKIEQYYDESILEYEKKLDNLKKVG